MKGPWSNTRLQVLLGALVVVTALSTHGTSGKKPAATGVTDASAAGPGLAPAAGQPAGGPPPPAPSTPSQAAPPAPEAPPQEAVGRPNPFAPLVGRQRFYAPQLGPAPPSRPLRPGGPGPTVPFGIDLPVPPGFPPNGEQAAPPPGAGMTVGAIIGGGSERVAIIQAQAGPQVVGVGDHVGDAVVVEIREDTVVMRRGAVTFELRFGSEGS
ncbi:MAG: hypothetical protein E6H04_12515 [Bacillati bacterium ANGP1]|uniref:Uncharacterized protein n=1 Tax=Candidatus Segetimicrobium genomatis TaxID=2569760 RepID=A0A537J4J5_9BACT|nr:MAG: hypothetical protein E6H04_12515 [Terrabacteria group bacterium ANGP1]